jgi:phosphate/sulfate permease
MEKHMLERLDTHEKRLTTVEILQDYQKKEIAGHKDSLSTVIKFNQKIQIALALMLGAYLGWDKIISTVVKFIS